MADPIECDVVIVGSGFAGALITATRRQTAHFSSLVSSSTDLVLVFGTGGCRYASRSVTTLLGTAEDAVLGTGFDRHVHTDDLPQLLQRQDVEGMNRRRQCGFVPRRLDFLASRHSFLGVRPVALRQVGFVEVRAQLGIS
jgi:PAS domain-containing protein